MKGVIKIFPRIFFKIFPKTFCDRFKAHRAFVMRSRAGLGAGSLEDLHHVARCESRRERQANAIDSVCLHAVPLRERLFRAD